MRHRGRSRPASARDAYTSGDTRSVGCNPHRVFRGDRDPQSELDRIGSNGSTAPLSDHKEGAQQPKTGGIRQAQIATTPRGRGVRGEASTAPLSCTGPPPAASPTPASGDTCASAATRIAVITVGGGGGERHRHQALTGRISGLTIIGRPRAASVLQVYTTIAIVIVAVSHCRTGCVPMIAQAWWVMMSQAPVVRAKVCSR